MRCSISIACILLATGNCIQFTDVVHPQPEHNTHTRTHGRTLGLAHLHRHERMPIRTHLQMQQYIHSYSQRIDFKLALCPKYRLFGMVFFIVWPVVHTYIHYTTRFFYCCIFRPRRTYVLSVSLYLSLLLHPPKQHTNVLRKRVINLLHSHKMECGEKRREHTVYAWAFQLNWIERKLVYWNGRFISVCTVWVRGTTAREGPRLIRF